MSQSVNITAIQAALSAAGFLRAATPPFNGQWDAVTRAGYAEYCRQHNMPERLQVQPDRIEDVPQPLRDAILADADGSGVADPVASPNPVTYSKTVGASGDQDLTTVTGGTVSAVSTVGILPASVTLSRTGNVIKAAGTPSIAGTGSFSLNITTDVGSITVPVNYTILAAPTATPNPVTAKDLTLNAAFDETVTTVDMDVSTGGVTAGAVPAGMQLGFTGSGNRNLRLYGTPTAAGAYTFTYTFQTANGPLAVPVSGTIA